jgi:predicted patatin/cPLA2 family phospholipase
VSKPHTVSVATVVTHPVADVLRARLREGCPPGARSDPYRVAVVLEGGGMRGVVSAGMTAALERLGLTRCFDLVVGSSAGALNAAALVAGVARPAAAMYHTVLASRKFVNPVRLLFGRPALDVRFVLAHASGGVDAGRHERTIASPIPLHCVALDVDSARPVEFTGMRTQDELWQVLLATTRMPWIGGDPVRIEGRRYIDGALTCPIPVSHAVDAGATHVLVLQTRPYGVPRSAGGRMGERLIARHLRGLNPALVPLWHGRVAEYEDLVERIARQSSARAGDGPHVLGLRPPAGTPVVTQLERRPEILARAAADAERLVLETLGE